MLSFSTNNMNVFLVARSLTGVFDNLISLSQAYMADITPLRERSRYLAQLESVLNTTQCVGPLLSALLSKIHLYVPLFVRFALFTRRWVATALYLTAFFYAIFFLPESVQSVIEKKKLIASFELVSKHRWFRIIVPKV